MNNSEKAQFLTVHLRHRLTLLRTFRERTTDGTSFNTRGDIYRCVKDANLIAVRLLMDFIGLKGVQNSGELQLILIKTFHPNDVRIDTFIGRLLKVNDVPEKDRQLLAGVYCRADKELAHLTEIFNDQYNEPALLIDAATAIENLLVKHLYGPLGVSLPEMDK